MAREMDNQGAPEARNVARRSPRFIPSSLDNVEPVEEYRPGGFYPMSLGDEFAQGRYKVLHKLGFGGSSTIWLARDRQQGALVTLKAMRADASRTSQSPDELPEIGVPKVLQRLYPDDFSAFFQAVKDNFLVQGANDIHRFLISRLAGPSVLAMSDSPGRISGSRRLRADLAKHVAKHTAETIRTLTIQRMHSAGFVHGDITTSNILFRVTDNVTKWSADEVCSILRPPETDDPIANSIITNPSFVQERTILVDFGQSYAVDNRPEDYEPGTAMHYLAPETRFEARAGMEADVWALGCAGFPLFEPFLGSDEDILRQTVETLGRLPAPWWDAFGQRKVWFDEDGSPISAEDQKREGEDSGGSFTQASTSSIRDKLRSVGTEDDDVYDGHLAEQSGTRIPEQEVEVFGDLLEKMMRYRPEERIKINEVVGHVWFANNGST
ncbi:kinase-like domain-containing protein [Mycena metata]|uniref:Kinase-like domain-containing protein n=1 Tax=Mycena metata TaxID=1033252 RepID=A0AAD7JNG0_9AGAR|nr:kinase-like domain-containing protein [Mycena metata]